MTKPPPSTPESRLPIRILKAVDLVFARAYHRLAIVRPSQLPAEGAGILVCNHISSLDPMLLQAAIPKRLVVWMMAKEYMNLRGLGWVFKTLGVIPVDRGNRDSASLRAALRALSDGRILGIFPEGGIGTADDLLPFHTGAALMAIRAKVPVYPAYLDGTPRGKSMTTASLRRQRAVVAFGPPVEFDRSGAGKDQVDAATAAIRSAIEDLRTAVCAADPGRPKIPCSPAAAPVDK